MAALVAAAALLALDLMSFPGTLSPHTLSPAAYVARRIRCRRPTLRCCVPPAPSNDILLGTSAPPAQSNDTLLRTSAPPAQPPGARLPLGPLPGADNLYVALTTPQFEIAVAALVLVSVVCYALDTLPSNELSPSTELLVSRVEGATAIIFAGEYLLRWWARSLRPSYLTKPLMIIDLLCIVPSLLGMLHVGGGAQGVESGARGSFTFLRVLRVLKLQRYVRDDESFSKLQLALGFLPSATRRTDLPLARVVLTLASLVLVTSGFLFEYEPQLPDYFTALYYALTTLTTIGTVEPETPQGALVVSASVLAGLAVVPLQLSRVAEAFMDSGEGGGASQQPAAAGERATRSEALLCCNACGARAHRSDAKYCYACGTALSALPVIVRSEEDD
ncbi:hypothetical protein KFE25_007114 [Diacronema lutheri]|uniref:Ion transport domain-containing protein n=1 Tax=Diacronema lutheri TaxID=2081491 RepID=A0A8J5XTE6_DIALT|nr:hypothetical protein KFE25_007114 [Diacronema lutheri]